MSGPHAGFAARFCDPWRCEECEALFNEGDRALEIDNGSSQEYGPSYYCAGCVAAAFAMFEDGRLVPPERIRKPPDVET